MQLCSNFTILLPIFFFEIQYRKCTKHIKKLSIYYQKIYYITKNSTSKLMSVFLDLNKSNIQLKISDTQNAIQLLKWITSLIVTLNCL